MRSAVTSSACSAAFAEQARSARCQQPSLRGPVRASEFAAIAGTVAARTELWIAIVSHSRVEGRPCRAQVD